MQTIAFTLTHPKYGNFTDAVTVANDATPAQIEQLQRERFEAWANFIENPPSAPPADEVVDG